MEAWQKVSRRTQETISVIVAFAPLFQVGVTDAAGLGNLVSGLAALAQGRDDAAREAAEAAREARDAAAQVRLLTLKVPGLIVGQIEADDPMLARIKAIYKVVPQTPALAVKRARLLVPVWVGANAALAALPVPEPPIVQRGVGVEDFQALLAALPEREQAARDAALAASGARRALAAAVRVLDGLNKRFYGALRALSDPGTAMAEALTGITTEPR